MARTRKKEKKEFQPFVIPADGKSFAGAFFSENPPELVVVEGDSFFAYGINAGDILIAQKPEFYLDEPVENYLTLWDVPNEKFLILGYAYENFGDLCVMSPTTTYSEKWHKAKLFGVVIGIIRQFVPRPAPAQIEKKVTEKQLEKDSIEITAVCEDCGKTQTGTRKFLQSMAWRIRKNSTHCVHCW